LVDKFMYGVDYPHAEGAWPKTRLALRQTFSDIDRGSVQRMLGDTAVDVFGMDRAKLSKIAERIGPTVGEIAQPYRLPDGEFGGLAFRTRGAHG
jgi:hypothetical protein